MKSYTKVYLDYFGYGETDFVPCEICSQRAVDIHHIISRRKDKTLLNDINNLMALCRSCHMKYGEINSQIDFLKETHKKRL